MAFFSCIGRNPTARAGRSAVDPATRDIVQNVYVRKTEKVNGRLADIEISTIPNVKDPWKEMNPAK